MPWVTDGLVPLCCSTLNWNTRRDVIKQWQMHLAQLLLDWTQIQWDQSLMESHWDWCIGQSNKSCAHYLQHESDLSKAPLHPIVTTTLMDLLHVDFTSIKMTLELNRLPKGANVLVFQDHFMKHVMVYVTPDQTAKTVAEFLYQAYISISGAPARLLSD